MLYLLGDRYSKLIIALTMVQIEYIIITCLGRHKASLRGSVCQSVCACKMCLACMRDCNVDCMKVIDGDIYYLSVMIPKDKFR